MLAQVSWQILNTLTQLPVLSDARMVQVEANLLKMIFEMVRWAAPFSAVHHARKLVDRVRFDSKSFAHLSRSRALTISDDVRRQCGAELAISLIHVLNHLLSLVSARKIQVNIRPFTAFFREETLKEQFPDRIDRRNSKGVANRAVCSRPTSLHEDFLFAAKSNDVPDDQEVPGKMQLFDQRQFALYLALGAFKQIIVPFSAIPVFKAFFRPLAKKRIHGFSLGNGIARKFVTEIGQRIFEACGKFTSVVNGLRKIRKQFHHLFCRTKMALVVSFKQPAGRFEFAVIPDAGEHIQNFALSGSCVADPIRGEERQAQRFAKPHRRLIAALFNNVTVSLQFDINILSAKYGRQQFNVLSCILETLV